jgi:signal transduction histidine kinase
VVIDRKLRIVYHNATAKEMLGLPDDLSNLRVSNFLRGVDWRAILNQDLDEWSKLVARQEIEIVYPTRRIIQFYLVPHGDSAETASLILNDVTESRERAASEAENERSQLVSTLAAGVAHEIGNPLNSLYLSLQLLQRNIAKDAFEKDDALSTLSEAKKEVERLDSIINQFLRALRPAKPNLVDLDLKELLVEALNFMRHEIEAREIKASCVWPEAVPRILGDPQQLKQAFYNLMKNAIQAMNNGGSLTISCDYDDESVNLRFSDSGSGIKPEDLSRIFKPYYTTKSSGTGLGLMIVDRIVRDHGAKLSVESVLGKGSVFTIKFPRTGRRVRFLQEPKPAAALPHSNEEEPSRK